MDTELTSQSVETDNSNEPSFEEHVASLVEPDTTDRETDGEDKVTETNDNEQPDNALNGVPDKFLKADGTVDVDKLSKSYKELESMQSSKATQYEKDRAELEALRKQIAEDQQRKEQEALNAGYASQLDMEQAFTVANYEANEYMKYVQYTDDPEEVQRMIVAYNQTADQELLKDIQMEFSPEITTRIAVQADRIRQNYQAQKEQFAQTQRMANMENVINQTVSENADYFEHQPMKDLFVNILGKYGDNFSTEDAKILLDTFGAMKEIYRQEFARENGIKLDNEKATDMLAAISGNNSAPAASQYPNIDNMSDKELAKFVRQII